MLPRRSDRRRTDLGTKRAPLLSSAAGRLPFPRVNSFQAPSRNWRLIDVSVIYLFWVELQEFLA